MLIYKADDEADEAACVKVTPGANKWLDFYSWVTKRAQDCLLVTQEKSFPNK